MDYVDTVAVFYAAKDITIERIQNGSNRVELIVVVKNNLGIASIQRPKNTINIYSLDNSEDDLFHGIYIGKKQNPQLNQNYIQFTEEELDFPVIFNENGQIRCTLNEKDSLIIRVQKNTRTFSVRRSFTQTTPIATDIYKVEPSEPIKVETVTESKVKVETMPEPKRKAATKSKPKTTKTQKPKRRRKPKNAN